MYSAIFDAHADSLQHAFNHEVYQTMATGGKARSRAGAKNTFNKFKIIKTIPNRSTIKLKFLSSTIPARTRSKRLHSSVHRPQFRPHHQFSSVQFSSVQFSSDHTIPYHTIRTCVTSGAPSHKVHRPLPYHGCATVDVRRRFILAPPSNPAFW